MAVSHIPLFSSCFQDVNVTVYISTGFQEFRNGGIMNVARKLMNTEPGSVITDSTKQLYDKLINSPSMTKEEAADLYKKELNLLCEKYHVNHYSELIELADASKVESAENSKILDYTSFLQRHQLQ
jgi:hypothetical protein